LHDIGRYEGVTGLRHAYSGYILMKEKGYCLNAKISLTHSFPNKKIETFIGTNDCTEEENRIIVEELNNNEYDDYDKLIQLCDSIGTAEGVCVMEIRLIDVVRRYHAYNETLLNKWNAYFEIKEYFGNKCGMNIYELYRNQIIDNIFKT
jgi:hypothetical protein